MFRDRLFCVGDIVELKSGGLPMTIYGLDADDSYHMHYFSDDVELSSAFFSGLALILVVSNQDFQNIKFHVGDTVKLKSGSPLMTITSIDLNDHRPYHVSWMTLSGICLTHYLWLNTIYIN